MVNPYYHCSICGVYTGEIQVGHRCNYRILSAIDATNTRAQNQLDSNEIPFWEISDPMNRSFYEKYRDYVDMVEFEE